MTLIVLCIKIFLARILDVSLNTVRTMMIVRKNKKWASLIAFFEVVIWYYSASSALRVKNNSLIVAVCYALGYAMGTLIGTILNEHFLSNSYKIEVLTTNQDKLIKFLNKHDIYYYTINATNNKVLISIMLSNKEYKLYIKKINQFDIEFLTILKKM